MIFASGLKLDLRQAVKLVVYSLLLVNFALYIGDDIRVASYTMRNGGTFFEWTRSFATTIDESAWFVLLFLFELETYLLSDEIQERPHVTTVIHGIRLLCYLSLLHSVYAFGITYFDLHQVTAIAEVNQLCQLLGPDISFVRNLQYTDLTAASCESLSAGGPFFYTEPGLVVSDASGLALERLLALMDLAEVLVWMLILFTIEAMVRLQDRAVTRGPVVSTIRVCKWVLYSLLWCMAAGWAYLGHWYFAWDEALWIVGFFAIEMNVSQWKKEIEHEASSNTTQATTEFTDPERGLQS